MHPGNEQKNFEESLEQALTWVVQIGRDAWPEIRIPAESFVGYLADRLDTGADVLESLRGLRVRDLYIACACSAGDAKAVSAFERAYLHEVDDVLGRMGISTAVRDDTKQILRRRFFLAEEGNPPRITEYSGYGDLNRWVRASAVRAALRIVRESKKFVGVDDSVLESLATPSQDLELDFLKRTYGATFEVALRESFAALAPRDRNLLRYYFGKGLSIDDLSVLYRVHRATTARRIQKANSALVSNTRNRLAMLLGIPRADVSSILRLIWSQIERTLNGILSAPRRAT